MKKSLQLLTGIQACALAALVSSTAHAAVTPNNNWYLGLSGDATWMRHTDTGGGGNVALGYRFVPSTYGDFRLEAEAGYHTADGSGGFSGTHYFSYMGNLYYDFTSHASNSNWNIVPYIGGGIGDAAISHGSNSFTGTLHHHNNSFAYDGMAGISFTSASMPGDWSIGYRYLGTDSDNIGSNNVELGVKFNF